MLEASLKTNKNLMTIEEFQNKFKKNKRFDKFYYHGLCYATIGFSLFMLFSVSTNTNINFTGNKTFHFVSFIFLLLFGVYGLFVLRKTYKLSCWENNLTKEENIALINSICSELIKTNVKIDDNSTYFIYRKSWWRTPYEVHLFADRNLIVINVEGLDSYDGGFIDFGASKRTQKRILEKMKEKASR